jgi:hypothetical protein
MPTRQQPKKQANDQMFAPGRLHRASVYKENNVRRFGILLHELDANEPRAHLFAYWTRAN